jgi:propanol-preferring alcohol dehydrogenase
MLAARLPGAGERLTIEELPLPQPTGTQVRVRVAGCGVCHTDLHIARGEISRVELPLTLGHEVAGWIDAWGPDARGSLADAALGKDGAVLVFGGWGCGECAECHAGAEQRCLTGRAPGFQEDGGYAGAMLVPHPRHLVALGSLDPVHAAPLADAGVTPYRAVLRAGRWLTPGARVLIIGLGGLGQFAVQYLRRSPGLRIGACELDPARLELGAELGTDIGFRSCDAAAAVAVQAGLGGAANVVFDFVGTDVTLLLAARVLAPDGLLMLVGEGGGHAPFGFDWPTESWLTTSAWGSLDDLRAVVGLAAEGAVRWTTEALPLTDAQLALDRLAAGDALGRLVLVPAGTTLIAPSAGRAYNGLDTGESNPG